MNCDIFHSKKLYILEDPLTTKLASKIRLLVFSAILGLPVLACRLGTPTPTQITDTVRSTATPVPLATRAPIPTQNTPTPFALSGSNLILNGDFSQGLEFWDIQTGQDCASCWMKVQSGDFEQPTFLSWERTQSEDNGSAITANQALNQDVQACDRLVLSFDLRLNNHSLPNSGWWSDQNSGSGEYPVSVYLRFLDPREQRFEWVHGFLAQHDGTTRLTNYTLVSLGQWTQFEADLRSPENWVDPLGAPLPEPMLLTNINVTGNGWDFAGDLTNLRLSGCPK